MKRLRRRQGASARAGSGRCHALADYRALWDSLAASTPRAYYFCDGSSGEQQLTQRGAALARRIADSIDIRPHHKVLELGCGVARLGLEMAALCAAWYGCDVSPRMLAIAKRRTSGIENVTLTLLHEMALSVYRDNSFDRSYSVGVFCHLRKEDVFRYLCEVRRVLKPGGVFCCGMWNLCAEGGWSLWTTHVRNDDGVLSHTWTTPQELDRLIRGAGFTMQALLTRSRYVVEAVASKGVTLASLRPTALVDDDSLFIER